MTFEVDVRAVGDEGQSGDAIAIRYGNFSDPSRTHVVIIDGGFKANGEDLVKHIREVYGRENVDLVIATHPDQDHISGLTVVLEELDVGEVWMHKPWDHSRSVSAYIRKGIAGTLTERQQRSIAGAKDLFQLAREKGIPVVEPFTGLSTPNGVIRVLGPTEEYYEELFAEAADAEKSAARGAYAALTEMIRKAMRWIKESWDTENLAEPGHMDVSPRNNSSAIILAQLDNTIFLFTGDAGVPALEAAVAPWGPSINGALSYLQIPHHGSKRNVGATILDFLLGPKLAQGQTTGRHAFISAAAKGNPKHPSRRVINAAIRRGAKVLVTAGVSHRYPSADAPDREGWASITPESFATEYED